MATPGDETREAIKHDKDQFAAPKSNSKGIYPPAVNQKFDLDGNVLPYPGNTIICSLSPESPLYLALLNLHSALQKAPFASLHALLPPPSYHMTVFEGVNDKPRVPNRWPPSLPRDAPLKDCTALYKQKLKDFDLQAEPPYKMAVYGFQPLEGGIGLRIIPASPSEERRLRELRDRFSEVLGIKAVGHEHYGFHVSISYMLRYLNEEQHREIWSFLKEFNESLPEYFELGRPEFCTFEDMFAFHLQCFVGEGS